MIFDNTINQKAKAIIKKHHLTFLAKTIGIDHLSDDDIKFLESQGIDIKEIIEHDHVETAFDVGRTRSQPRAGTPEVTSIPEFKAEPKPYVTEEAKYAIDYVKAQVTDSTNSLMAKIQQGVSAAITEGNLTYRNFLMTPESANVISQGIMRNDTIMKVAANLRDQAEDYNRNWRRVATTELLNAHSHGAAEQFQRMNTGKTPDEIYVFKQPVKDEALCPHCRKLYLNPDGTPKIYTLKQLQANGTNYGRKAAMYLPVVGSSHPNCRCLIEYLPEGFGFDKNGDMEFKDVTYKPEITS